MLDDFDVGLVDHRTVKIHMPPTVLPSRVGVILIGRNEGERFKRSLRSALASGYPVVYVDSGSTDGSPDHAARQGAIVHALDLRTPFTAARARNQGLRDLLAHHPQTEFVQFIDGDCELVDGWLARAMERIQAEPRLAVACGRRRETFPGASVYNQLCDLEWDTPVGPARYCGGDALMRVGALAQVGGYRDDLIAGEEPELCVRLRAAGWTIERLDAEMTRHDAAMTGLGQWWRRSKRAGHAFAEGYALHGAPPERHYRREVQRPWFWAFALPVSAAMAALAWGWPAALVPLALYPVQVARQAGRAAPGAPLRWRQPVFQMLGKFAELHGQFVYLSHRIRGRRAGIMEYKA